MTLRVEAWTPGLVRAEGLIGMTGTVITYDDDPSWPVFLVYGTEDKVTVGNTQYCMMPAQAHGRFKVTSVEYRNVKLGGDLSTDVPEAIMLEVSSV